ncbi:hypothetical protein XELAEV_18014807mg [Xenopus laevis]|uniref:Uncharacterized protein n=1 Tax=Xenopus laevis TaxID=8355 RepID=A0A974HVM0_XENLA|nr:hypothetical protein XELAEV_18014807mg [Xenopus laevis]
MVLPASEVFLRKMINLQIKLPVLPKRILLFLLLLPHVLTSGPAKPRRIQLLQQDPRKSALVMCPIKKCYGKRNLSYQVIQSFDTQ